MQQPSIHATDYAVTRIQQVRDNHKQPDAGVRIAITGRSRGEFLYDLDLVFAGQEREGDMVINGPQGIAFYAPLATVPYLDGITLDADRLSGALTVRNPNPLWMNPLAEQVQSFLDEDINPMVAGHGGHIDLLDVAEGRAYIHMGGACQGCGMADVTLGQGVRVALLERFPEIGEVVDSTNHAEGTNPYYQAAKK
jgi:Fe/S biogenesis protein NfuA